MDTLSISLESEEGMWFGVLVDHRNQLVASSFSTKRDPLWSYLASLARKLTTKEPRTARSSMADTMIGLFNGRERTRDIPMNNESVSTFQERVYKVLREIPRGRVTSYGTIAAAINSGPRAVGTAVASNPWPLFVPCHRVVPSSLTVGNYSMSGRLSDEGSEIKKNLLIREGVLFEHDKILAASFWKLAED